MIEFAPYPQTRLLLRHSVMRDIHAWVGLFITPEVQRLARQYYGLFQVKAIPRSEYTTILTGLPWQDTQPTFFTTRHLHYLHTMLGLRDPVTHTPLDVEQMQADIADPDAYWEHPWENVLVINTDWSMDAINAACVRLHDPETYMQMQLTERGMGVSVHAWYDQWDGRLVVDDSMTVPWTWLCAATSPPGCGLFREYSSTTAEPPDVD